MFPQVTDQSSIFVVSSGFPSDGYLRNLGRFEMERRVANKDRFHCAWTVLLGIACFPSGRKVRYEKALQVPKRTCYLSMLTQQNEDKATKDGHVYQLQHYTTRQNLFLQFIILSSS